MSDRAAKFQALADEIGELPTCDFCGRCVLAGWCCVQARMRSLRRYISDQKTSPHDRREAMRTLKKLGRRLRAE